MKNNLNPKIHLIEFEYGTVIHIGNVIREHSRFTGLWHPDIYATEAANILQLVDDKSQDYDVVLLITALMDEPWGAHRYTDGTHDIGEQLKVQRFIKTITDHLAVECGVSIIVVADEARLAASDGGTIKTTSNYLIPDSPNYRLIRMSYEQKFDIKNILNEVQDRVNKIIERRIDVINESLDAEMIGKSPAHKKVLDAIKKVAPNKYSVLILGENGTGKELVARAIHKNGNRADKIFVPVNCGAIASTLIESELFGHAEGAFTGASKEKKGFIEVANGGTLFLDEIGELPLNAQVKLLRMLENKKVTKVGSTIEIDVDVKVIAATNRDLKKMMHEQLFREDLYYRLEMSTLTLPTLNERSEDIKLLARHFLDIYNRENSTAIQIGKGVINRLQLFNWTGNIRQLRNTMFELSMYQEGDIITSAQVDEYLNKRAGMTSNEILGALLPLERVEQEHILRVYKKLDENTVRTANILGISTKTLTRKLQKYMM
jgi:transcriptional regulator with PAS, ATPase and Fis domain